MSRRKQSNPKSIKLSADPLGLTEDNSSQNADVKQEVLSDAAENSDSEMRIRLLNKHNSPYPRSESPGHIDVVNSSCSPVSSPVPTTSKTSSKTPPPPPLLQQIKAETNEDTGNSNENDLVSIGSPHASDGQSVTQGLVRHLQLPSDVLYLKRLEVNVHGNPTVGWVVCSAIPLPKGSSLGPFSGEMIASDAIKVGDLIVQFCSSSGHRALVNVAGHSGAWLALLRPAVDLAIRNTHVYWEGGRIWCEIVADVDIGTELLATFAFDLDELPSAERGTTLAPASPVSVASDRPLSRESPSQTQQHQSSSSLQQPSPPGHAALIYGCPFCGVRFSSPRTLQGHLSYYCSKKNSDFIVNPNPKSSPGVESNKNNLVKQQENTKIKQEPSSSSHENSEPSSPVQPKLPLAVSHKRGAAPVDHDTSDHQSSSPAAKIQCIDLQTFRCPFCSYCADRPASLNRHMRIHNRPLVHSAMSNGSESSTSLSSAMIQSVDTNATFCQECNIQFSSINTFRCHKEFYCSQRRTGSLPAPLTDHKVDGHSTLMGMPVSISLTTDLPLAAVGQGGLLLPTASQVMTTTAGALAAGGTVIPAGQGAVILTAPVMTATGLANMAITMPTAFVQSIQSAAVAVAAAASVTSSAHQLITQPKSSRSPHISDSNTAMQKVLEEAHQSKSPKRVHSSVHDDSKELPLDLSTKRSESVKQKEKKDNSISPKFKNMKIEVDLERSPNLMHPASLISPDAPTVNRSDIHIRTPVSPAVVVSSASITGFPPLVSTSSLLSTFLPLPSSGITGTSGLPVVAQSSSLGTTSSNVSKCMDCNIIFYKHDNFLIHKQHYCSGSKSRTGLAASSAPQLSPRVLEPPTVTKSLDNAMATPLSESLPSHSPSNTPTPTPTPSSSTPTPVPVKTEYTPPLNTINPVKVASHSVKNATSGPEEIYYKFFCIPCKIKFSSASNLKAHKEFYCPHGKNSEHTIILHTQGGEIVGTSEQQSPEASMSPGPGQYRCAQCNTVFTSSRLLKLHLCTVEMVQASLMRCSHCDYVTQTDKRLAEHMKVHKPTSAYRCMLCGYRGNTVRGMRMHGKTHTDNGEDFTDSHMVEYQEPPLVPIQTNNGHKTPQGLIDLEAELIRLKNEPYKRRRSRKAFEKVDTLSFTDTPHVCQLCGECFMDVRSLSMHVRIHEMASQYNEALSRCDHCEYVARSLEDLRAHVNFSHSLISKEEKENHPQLSSPERHLSSERTSNGSCPSSCEKSFSVHIKEELIDPGYEHSNSSTNHNVNSSEDRDTRTDNWGEPREMQHSDERMPSDNSSEFSQRSVNSSPNVERLDTIHTSCAVSVTDRQEVSVTDRQAVPTEIPIGSVPIVKEACVIKCEPDTERINNNACTQVSKSSVFSLTGQSHLSSNNSDALITPIVDSDRKDLSPPLKSSSKPESKILTLATPVPTNGAFPFFLVPNSTSIAESPDLVASARGLSKREGGTVEGEVSGPPYCKNCDISFTYLSTFIAHKKYYCTGRANVQPSATA